MATQIHLLLAFVSAAATALVAAEAAWRAVRDLPSVALARWLSAGQVTALGITTIAGLALVALGEQPGNSIHYLLAVLALALNPAVSMFLTGARGRVRAAATSITALGALAVVALLFMTG